RERHLCERCANEEGVTAQKHESINTILDSFIKHAAGVQKMSETPCADCGTTFREFRSQGLLGCARCYTAFEKPLLSLIERAHEGATHHVGKVPSRLGGEPSIHTRIAQTRRQLREAIKQEDYEAAARLRDEIKEIESP
ncbi:MAG: UvrB/UvrC motif-containing protein, partial [Phycisphaerae bacterium]